MKGYTFLLPDPEINNYDMLNEVIRNSKSTVFFGGAGVSTESGIPDFRSKDGLYNQHDIGFENYRPEYLLSRECLYHNPKVFFEFYRQKMDVRKCLPNKAHIKLAEMEVAGKLSGIVTQNIDGLHQRAGSVVVAEIHGTTRGNYCTKCGEKVGPDFIFDSGDPIPRCPHCTYGMVRPDVVLYGEHLPKKQMNLAYELVSNADTLIVGGTSLTVQPAAGLISEFTGNTLIVMNTEKIGYSLHPDMVFTDPIGEVMSKIEL